MGSSTFLKIAAALYLATLLLVGGFNALVDPYALFGGPSIAGFNAVKPLLPNHLRIHKTYRVSDHQPRALVLGTSRAARIDPLHPAWGETPAYNLATPGAKPHESLRWLQHAHAVTPIERVVMGLDLFVFNAHYPALQPSDEQRLAVDAAGASHPFWRLQRYAHLLSWDLTKASFETVAEQRTKEGLEVHPLGRWEHRVAPDPLPASRKSERTYLTTSWFPPPARRFTLAEEAPGTAMGSLRELVRFCTRHGIDLHLYISPSHARHWEALDAAGLWPSFERWKRRLTRLVADERQAASSRLTLWDFSGANRYTTEALPAKGAGKRMAWYVESSHFSKALGDRLLDRMLTEASDDDGFGVRLTPESLVAHLERLHLSQQRYRARHPEEAADVARIATQTSEQRIGID